MAYGSAEVVDTASCVFGVSGTSGSRSLSHTRRFVPKALYVCGHGVQHAARDPGMAACHHRVVTRIIGSPSWYKMFNGLRGVTIEADLCAPTHKNSPRVKSFAKGDTGRLVVDIEVPMASDAGRIVRQLRERAQNADMLLDGDAITADHDRSRFILKCECTGEIMEQTEPNKFIRCEFPRVGAQCEVRLFFSPQPESPRGAKPRIMNIFLL